MRPPEDSKLLLMCPGKDQASQHPQEKGTPVDQDTGCSLISVHLSMKVWEEKDIG